MRILKSHIDGLSYKQRYRMKFKPKKTLKQLAHEKSSPEQQRKNEYMRHWRRANPEKALAASRRFWTKNKEVHRNNRFLRLYGIGYDEAQELKKRPCDCCGESDKPRRIDHDHSDPRPSFRGVLCDACNLALGHIEKRGADRLLAYLSKTKKL